ncbi:hypothetical protein F4802DRAFT_601605 [Xylaria palmicola]|nr:hypothetical protein F4802DRAFT_601605 [Xylaria palmicola]
MGFLATIAAVSTALSAGPRMLANAMNATAPSGTNGTVHSFADSCTTYSIHQVDHDAYLGAVCRAEDGSQPYSSLNLNLCIANTFGQMEACADGDFAQTCNRMLIHGARPVLYAYCDNGKYPVETTIDLGNFVDNDNGRLHCFGHYAA